MNEWKRAAVKIVLLGLITVLTFSFWSVWAEKLRLFSLRADVLPFLAAYIAIFFGKEWGAGFGCFIGVLADTAAEGTMGFYTVFVMIGAILVGLISEKYYRTHLLAGFLSGYALYVLLNLLRLLFFFVIPGKASFLVFFTYFLPAGLYSLLWSVPIYLILRRIWRRVEE